MLESKLHPPQRQHKYSMNALLLAELNWKEGEGGDTPESREEDTTSFLYLST